MKRDSVVQGQEVDKKSGYCGDCELYAKSLSDDNYFCRRTGRLVGWLQKRDCFTPRKVPPQRKANGQVLEQIRKKIAMNENDSQLNPQAESEDSTPRRGRRKKVEPNPLVDVKPESQRLKTVLCLSDKELVDELRARGYTVTCTKLIEL